MVFAYLVERDRKELRDGTVRWHGLRLVVRFGAGWHATVIEIQILRFVPPTLRVHSEGCGGHGGDQSDGGLTRGCLRRFRLSVGLGTARSCRLDASWQGSSASACPSRRCRSTPLAVTRITSSDARTSTPRRQNWVDARVTHPSGDFDPGDGGSV